MTPSERRFDNFKVISLCVTIILLAGAFVAQAMENNVVIRNTGVISVSEVIANSGSAADIQVAVNQVASVAERGVVHIPAGNFNFVSVGEPWRTVNLPAGIDILGATTEKDANGQVVQWQTVLIMPYDVPGDWNNVPVWFKIGNGAQDPDKPSRFSDIKLQGYRSINASSKTIHRGIEIYGVINFRIDHCMFEHTTGGGVAIPTYYQQNMKCSGVIDHTKFVNYHGFDDLANYVNGNIGYGVQVQRSLVTGTGAPMPFEPTMDILGKYTDHTVFIEDCYFSKWRHCVASSHGGYYVFRYNIIDQDFGHFSLDVHGLRDVEVGRAGGRGAEVYENVIHNLDEGEAPPSVHGVMQDGGGCGVWFNNYVDSTYSSILLYAEDYVASETWHLKDFYMWSTKGTWTPSVGYPNGPIDQSRHVVEDWDRPAYNWTDPSYPNTDPSWSIAGYKPFPYPHPLTMGTIPAF